MTSYGSREGDETSGLLSSRLICVYAVCIQSFMYRPTTAWRLALCGLSLYFLLFTMLLCFYVTFLTTNADSWFPAIIIVVYSIGWMAVFVCILKFLAPATPPHLTDYLYVTTTFVYLSNFCCVLCLFLQPQTQP